MAKSLARRDLVRSLRRKFGFEESAGAKHNRYVLWVDGKKVAITSVSRGTKYRELSAPILSKIAGQVNASSLGYLVEMVECSKSPKDYLKLLKDDGHIQSERPG